MTSGVDSLKMKVRYSALVMGLSVANGVDSLKMKVRYSQIGCGNHNLIMC